MNSDQESNNEPGSSLQEAGPRRDQRSAAAIFRNKSIVIAVLMALLAAAALIFIFVSRRNPSGQAGRPVPQPSSAGNAVPSPSSQRQAFSQPQQDEIIITLSPDKIENAQIKTQPAITGAVERPAGGPGLRTTGTVASNAYKETPVFPIAGGIVNKVDAQLGDKVKRGQPLAILFSTELANAQGDYLKMRADYEEHEKAHHRTAQLVEIGAASREELEQHQAKVDSMRASLAAARQQLIQLGMTPKQVDALNSPGQVSALLSVTAPESGTVIGRTVNSGEVVATGKELFRIADLSSVWVLGQIYEKDFGAIRLGIPATITAPSYPGKTLSGHVSYLDPRVDPQTRTAQVRIEVPNPGGLLKIGMFVDVSLGAGAPTTGAAQPSVLVPRAAVQTIGSKQVVFVATDRPGVFIQRQVSVGPESDGRVAVYSGVGPTDRIVTDGSFLLRAESLKINPDQANH